MTNFGVSLAVELRKPITKLYRSACTKALFITQRRRTMTSRLIAHGHSVEAIQQLLGHAELNHVRPYVQVSQTRLEEMFTGVR
jgi:site-specific recombinase XerD